MRRGDSASHRYVMGQGLVPSPENNPKLCVQLGEEAHNANQAILETVQELKNEMTWLREDNVWLSMEQERILKSLSDNQNQQPLNPIAIQNRVLKEQNHHTEPEGSEGRDEKWGERSDNAFE